MTEQEFEKHKENISKQLDYMALGKKRKFHRNQSCLFEEEIYNKDNIYQSQLFKREELFEDLKLFS